MNDKKFSVIESNDKSEMFQPTEKCPEYWPETVMGRNIGGVSGPMPADVDYRPTAEKDPGSPAAMEESGEKY